MPVARFFTGLRQGPLYHCEDAVSMISHIKMLGSSSLLELASLHGIHLDVNTPKREMLRDVIVRHLISGECRDMNATLCVSVRSVLLPSTEPGGQTGLKPQILDAAINLGTKKTLQRALRHLGTPHASTDPISFLRSLLAKHRDASGGIVFK